MVQLHLVPRPPAFSRDLDLVVLKHGVMAGGRAFAIGEAFDKSLVTTRRLRQLYEGRFLTTPEYATRVGVATGEAPKPARRRIRAKA